MFCYSRMPMLRLIGLPRGPCCKSAPKALYLLPMTCEPG